MEIPEYFEELIKKQFEHVNINQEDIKDRLEKILVQTTITNGRVRELERWRASSQGHWSGVNKTLAVLWILSAFIGGAIITYLWH